MKNPFKEKKNNEDLGIVIELPETALWMKVRDARTQTIKDLQDSLTIEKEVLKLAEQRIAELKNPKK